MLLLQSEGASRGIIQSYEQFYMGLIRRAALMGLIEPPAEGPWSLAWQNVLDAVGSRPRAKSIMRCFAAWASAKGIEPKSASDVIVEEWSGVVGVIDQGEAIDLVRSILAGMQDGGRSLSTSRKQRLIMKASSGSVRNLEAVYGLRRRAS